MPAAGDGQYLAGEGAWDRRQPEPPGSPRGGAAREGQRTGAVLRRTSMGHPSFKRKQILAADGAPSNQSQQPP